MKAISDSDLKPIMIGAKRRDAGEVIMAELIDIRQLESEGGARK